MTATDHGTIATRPWVRPANGWELELRSRLGHNKLRAKFDVHRSQPRDEGARRGGERCGGQVLLWKW